MQAPDQTDTRPQPLHCGNDLRPDAPTLLDVGKMHTRTGVFIGFGGPQGHAGQIPSHAGDDHFVSEPPLSKQWIAAGSMISHSLQFSAVKTKVQQNPSSGLYANCQSRRNSINSPATGDDSRIWIRQTRRRWTILAEIGKASRTIDCFRRSAAERYFGSKAEVRIVVSRQPRKRRQADQRQDSQRQSLSAARPLSIARGQRLTRRIRIWRLCIVASGAVVEEQKAIMAVATN